MALEFYGLKYSPPCWAALSLGHHMGLEFNFHEVDILTAKHLEEDFVKLNPQHLIPTIVDGDLTLWESRAIMQYFANKYDTAGSLYPVEPEMRAKVDQKLYFDMNLFNLLREYYFAKLLNLPLFDPAKLKKIEQQFEYLDNALQDHNYVAGDEVTIADFTLMSTVTVSVIGKFPLEKYENVAKWYELCKESIPGTVPDEDSQEVIVSFVEATYKAAEEQEEEAANAEEQGEAGEEAEGEAEAEGGEETKEEEE